MQKRVLLDTTYVLFFLFLYSNNVQATNNKISYNELFPLAAQALSSETLAQPKDKNFTQPLVLSERQRHELAYQLLATNDKKIASDTTVAKRLLTDLDMFYIKSDTNENSSRHLFSKIDRTQTIFGQAALANFIANPTSNIQLLHTRQKAINALTHNNDTRQKLTKTLAKIQSVQNNFLNSFATLHEEAQHAYDDLLFELGPLKKYNTNTYALEFLAKSEKFTLPQLYQLLYRGINLTLFSCDLYGAQHSTITKKINSLIVQAGVNFLSLLESAIDLRKAIKESQHARQRESHLHTQLNAAAIIIKNFKRIKDHCNACPELKAILPDLTVTQQSPDFKKLAYILTSPTFKKNSNPWFRSSGTIRAAYHLMQKTRHEFAPMVRYLAEVDALLSTAKLMKEQENQHATYSFAHFIQQDTPSIELKDTWNPMVAPSVVVTNDMALGQEETTRGALVTGSNTGGKSTIMINGLTTAVLLAQTLGIAPARSCTLTPFDHIITSLKIQSDASKGFSHLKAEVDRAREIITTLKQHPAGTKTFVAIDELFEGAAANDGPECVYEIGKQLAALAHVVWVMVTQFQGKPTELERDTKGICKNFNVDVIKHADGKIERPHTIARGVSKVQGVAQLLLKQALDA